MTDLVAFYERMDELEEENTKLKEILKFYAYEHNIKCVSSKEEIDELAAFIKHKIKF